MKVHKIIRKAFVDETGGFGDRDDKRIAKLIEEALISSGFRIIGPSQFCHKTLEASARVADELKLATDEAPSSRIVEDAIQNAAIASAAEDIAAKIRQLGEAS